MPFSLFDAVVPSNLQILGAVDALLVKAEAFCAEHGRPEADLIDTRLAPDLSPWPTDFAGLHGALQTAIDALNGIDRDAFDALADSDTQFAFGEMRMPFTGANFLLSFSQPNFYFHATTAYAILRVQGVKLGKRLHGHAAHQAMTPCSARRSHLS